MDCLKQKQEHIVKFQNIYKSKMYAVHSSKGWEQRIENILLQGAYIIHEVV